jgi:excinuclease UvrABC helicase subunit UvrB
LLTPNNADSFLETEQFLLDVIRIPHLLDPAHMTADENRQFERLMTQLSLQLADDARLNLQ